MAPLLAVHDADYLAFLERAHRDWIAAGRNGDAIGYTFPIRRRRPLSFGRIDADLGAYSYDAGTPIAAGTWESAYWSAQCALSALDELRSEEHTSELQSLMRISYAVFCSKKKNNTHTHKT